MKKVKISIPSDLAQDARVFAAQDGHASLTSYVAYLLGQESKKRKLMARIKTLREQTEALESLSVGQHYPFNEFTTVDKAWQDLGMAEQLSEISGHSQLPFDYENADGGSRSLKFGREELLFLIIEDKNAGRSDRKSIPTPGVHVGYFDRSEEVFRAPSSPVPIFRVVGFKKTGVDLQRNDEDES